MESEAKDAVPYLSLLPRELLMVIFDYLTVNELGRLCLISKNCKTLAEADSIWSKFIASVSTLNLICYKSIYKHYVHTWINGNYKKFELNIEDMEGRHLYICKVFGDTLFTGSFSDVMQERDLKQEGKLIRSYEVPTGPATDYRMDFKDLVIKSSGSIDRWRRDPAKGKRHADPGEFSFSFRKLNPMSCVYDFYENELVLFVRERDSPSEGDLIQVWDMDQNKRVHSIVPPQHDSLPTWRSIQVDNEKCLVAQDCSIHQYDKRLGSLVRTWTMTNRSSCLQFNDTKIAVGSQNCAVDLFDFRADKPITTLTPKFQTDKDKENPFVLDEMSNHPSVCRLLFNRYIIAAGTNSCISIYNLAREEFLYNLTWMRDSSCYSLGDISLSDSYLAVITNYDICVWSVNC